MNLRFETVEIKNFFSFEDAEIKLGNSGYTLVSGKNENPDDNAASNGSGKSSIWESIVWCLTGDTIRETKQVERIGSEDTTSVKLTFKVDNNKYEITRTKNPSNLFIYINGENKSGKGIRDTAELLEQYLPDLTASLIGSVIVLGQGLPQRFTNNSPSGRKEVLEKLSKSDFMIEDIKSRLINRKTELNTQIRGIENSNISLETSKSMLEENSRLTQSKLDDLNKEDINQLNESIAKLNSQLSDLNNKKDVAEKSLTTFNKELSKHQKALSNALNDLQQQLSSIDIEYKDQLDTLNKEYRDVSIQINTLGSEIYRLDNIKDTCPTCGQKLVGVEKPDTSKQKKDLEKSKKNLNKINNQIQSINQEINTKKQNIKISIESDKQIINENINNTTKDRDNANNVISLINTNILSLSNQIITLQNSANTLEQKKQEYSNIIVDNNKKIVDISNKILYNNNELANMKSHFEVVSKMETYIKRDFRGYLLMNVIDFINKKAKEYCQEVFETDKIDFYQDGNNLLISYDGKDYSNLSGGEKQKIDLIIQFSIRDMLCSYLNFSSNIIVLDEIFDNLDSNGCQKVLNLVSSKLTDVDSIFIVTHHSDLEIPCDSEINVVKGKDKISRIN